MVEMQTPYLFPIGAKLGTDNVVLQARARRHKVENYAGPLSIKTVIAGQVSWIVSGHELLVDPSSFLIIAADEKYSMNIDEPRPVETCCVFFAPDFVERIAFEVTSPLEQSLDAPNRAAPAIPYLSALHGDRERTLLNRVRSLAPRCKAAILPSAFEEDFIVLAGQLLQFYKQIREETARIPAAKASTRQELFRRLLLGREYIHSHTSAPVSLAAAARAACLSPFHFHRGFKQAFQKTPHEYLTSLRLDRARILLQSQSSVLEACLEAGFASPSAFSRQYRAHFGEPPSAVRRKFARSGKNSTIVSGTLAS